MTGIACRLRSRLPGGELANQLKTAVADVFRYGPSPCLALLRDKSIRYFLGWKAAVNLGVRVRSTHVTGLAEESLPLWHMTYESLLPAIMAEGLRGPGYVFLTDSLDIAPAYYPWKDSVVKSPEGRCVLEIDPRLLRDSGRAPLRLEAPHELITGRVPAGCIISASAYENGVLSPLALWTGAAPGRFAAGEENELEVIL